MYIGFSVFGLFVCVCVCVCVLQEGSCLNVCVLVCVCVRARVYVCVAGRFVSPSTRAQRARGGGKAPTSPTARKTSGAEVLDSLDLAGTWERERMGMGVGVGVAGSGCRGRKAVDPVAEDELLALIDGGGGVRVKQVWERDVGGNGGERGVAGGGGRRARGCTAWGVEGPVGRWLEGQVVVGNGGAGRGVVRV